jgi:hypothetical protein
MRDCIAYHEKCNDGGKAGEPLVGNARLHVCACALSELSGLHLLWRHGRVWHDYEKNIVNWFNNMD